MKRNAKGNRDRFILSLLSGLLILFLFTGCTHSSCSVSGQVTMGGAIRK